MLGIISLVLSLCSLLVPMIGGIVLIVYGKRSRRKNLEKYSYKTTAKIVGFQNTTRLRYQGSRNDYTDGCAPVYEYYYNGQYYTAVSSISTPSPNLQIGSTITLHINPRNPLDIYEPEAAKVFYVIAMVVGVICIIVSIILILSRLVSMLLPIWLSSVM